MTGKLGLSLSNLLVLYTHILDVGWIVLLLLNSIPEKVNTAALPLLSHERRLLGADSTSFYDEPNTGPTSLCRSNNFLAPICSVGDLISWLGSVLC